jgi:hypothetical protein
MSASNLPLLLILALWPRDSRSQDSTLFSFPKDEAQGLYKTVSENPLLKEEIAALEEADRVNRQQITNLEQQLEIQKKLTEIAEKWAEVEHIAYERQKELTDRAIKLAEVGKPKSNWELQGILGAAVFVLGFLAGR